MSAAPVVDKRAILSLAMLTLIGFPLIGMFLVTSFSDHDIQVMVRGSQPVYYQLGLGLVIGTVMGYLAHLLTTTKLLRPSTNRYTRLFGAMKLNTVDKILISVCAGFGEELLFRGAIQIFWGVIMTAVFFVAIHGYINLRDWRISIYGILMTMFIIVLGFMTERVGIWSAVMAHTMIDVVLLLMMKDDGPHVPIDLASEEV